MGPVVRLARSSSDFDPVVISTGQHHDLLEHTLDIVEIQPDIRIDSVPSSALSAAVGGMVTSIGKILRQVGPHVVLVQGDTTTALAASLSAFYEGMLVGHVEAGLRTRNLQHPFPEEANRQLIDRLATWLFAPTESAALNLSQEGVSQNKITVTGNTGIDALLWMLKRLTRIDNPEDEFLLVTLHRRESAGLHFREIIRGLGDFLQASNVRAVWPIHPNPIVQAAIDSMPDVAQRIDFVPAQPYDEFVLLMRRARVIISDSGGVQEEAPSLGKPVVVVRETTERPEAVAGGRNVIAGRSREEVRKALRSAWSAESYAGPIPAPNPFGDGNAAARILARLSESL
jgi:UDP-N-acetylglucosamine 2-epimerase